MSNNPYKSTPGGIFYILFRPSLYLRGCVDYRTSFGRTPENISKSKVSHWWTPFTHNTHAPLRIPVSAWRQLLRPITVGRSSLRPRTYRYLLLPHPERGTRRFVPGPPRLPVPVLVLPLLPWLKPRRRVPIPVKRKKLQQKRPTLQPQSLRPRQQHTNRQPLLPVIWPSPFALDSNRRPVTTPPQ